MRLFHIAPEKCDEQECLAKKQHSMGVLLSSVLPSTLTLEHQRHGKSGDERCGDTACGGAEASGQSTEESFRLYGFLDAGVDEIAEAGQGCGRAGACKFDQGFI